MTHFGPNHPFKQTTEAARKAGKAARKVSSWNRGPMILSDRARKIFEQNAKPTIKDKSNA